MSDLLQKLRDRMGSLGKRGGGDGAASGGKFNAAKAVQWVKKHPAIVAAVALMVIAPVTAWWFSSEIHAAADAAAQKRASEMTALENLEKSSVEIVLPGKEPQNQTGVVTPKMVAAYEELAAKLRTDATEVQRQALAHNQRGRNALIADVTVTPSNVNLIALHVFDAVQEHMSKVLTELRVGAPPTFDGLNDLLQRRQDQFIAAERKADRKSLNEEQLGRLKQALLEKRLQIYADAAVNLSFYADQAELGLPSDPASAGSPPSPARLFDWQWRTWIAEDLLRAFASANAPYRSVVDAPVKRVLSITIPEDTSLAAGAPAAAAPAAPSGDAPAEAPASPFTAIDAKQPAAYNFASSFTGRVTGPLYDVRRARVQMVVATSMLPAVLNAIAQQNFMTVTNLVVRPEDAFEAARDGYIYGAAPVSEITITIESIWMREWIAKIMPPEMQRNKGTDGRTVDSPAPSPDSTASASPST